MTYEEALRKVQKHTNLIGRPLGEYKVEYLIISTLDNLGNVVATYLTNGFDNEQALSEHGLLNNNNLLVYLWPAKYLKYYSFTELEEYLSQYSGEL